MVKRDEDGYYTLVDRKANMIITGGENVYPSEVEGCVAANHKAVRDVAVIGIPDPKWGEAIKAVVVLNQGMNRARSWPKRSSTRPRARSPVSNGPRPLILSRMRRCPERLRERFSTAFSGKNTEPGASRKNSPIQIDTGGKALC
jgi:acyl-CoA synthetase (AMP-forming)/AMP-acid ligase II